MSPMPTPEYEAFLNDMRRAGRRADGEKQAPDRSDAARDSSGVRPDLSDPRLLDEPVTRPAALGPLWKAEVIADDSGKWETNGLCFGTEAEALEYGRDLSARWTAVRDFRAREATKEEEEVWIAKGRYEEPDDG